MSAGSGDTVATASDTHTVLRRSSQQVAIVVYPGFTAMDVIGPYDVLGRLPDCEVLFVAEQPGLVTNDLQSLSINVVASLADVPNPDVVLIGGGAGQIEQMRDGRLHEWLRAVDRTTAWTASVCTGALILAAAGLLDGRRATTHWATLDHLAAFGATPSNERVVIDGHYATAAGVSAGIDLALTLAGSIAGRETAEVIQLVIEYAPAPPYSAGTLDSASPRVIARATDSLPKRARPERGAVPPVRRPTTFVELGRFNETLIRSLTHPDSSTRSMSCH